MTSLTIQGEKFEVRVPAPALGEHTYEVLEGLGHSHAELDALKARKII